MEIKEQENILKNPDRLKKYCIDYLRNNLSDKFINDTNEYKFRIFDNSENCLNYTVFSDFLDNELTILEYITKNKDWILLTTNRLILNENKQLHLINFDDIADIDEFALENTDWYGEINQFDKFSIKLKTNEIFTFEIKTGIPILAFLNCMQRILRLYFRFS